MTIPRTCWRCRPSWSHSAAWHGAFGAEALELAATSEFAVILLDVMMPGMDGFETLARLRATPKAEHVPVILVTAYELDARAMGRVQGMGTVDYILKPIASELLRSKVAAFVSLHRRGEELRRRGEALAAKDRNIAMLAHDLQSPLAAVATSPLCCFVRIWILDTTRPPSGSPEASRG